MLGSNGIELVIVDKLGRMLILAWMGIELELVVLGRN
uniref:Uncharacterized protein n=1 Tax=Siphoviridae sp. ctqSm5 TaxID=2827949 RepID=A0A8S5SP79_9CAUD|nr:MAG TPA: hypothetical protein [Siphoviridae sp. ctqSm5]